MSIRQTNKIESQVWNSDMQEFYNENARFLSISNTDFTPYEENPIRILLDANGVYHLSGNIQYVGVTGLSPGITTLTTLPIDLTEKVGDIILPTFVVNTVQPDLSFFCGIGVEDNTKELKFYGLNNNMVINQSIIGVELSIETLKS